MDTKLIEELEKELEAHSTALEKAASLCEQQATKIIEMEEAHDTAMDLAVYRIKELEAEIAEAADHVGRAEMAEAAMRAERDHWKAQCQRMFDLPKIIEERNQLADLACPWYRVFDHVPDAGKLCAEMDEEFALASESQRIAAESADEKPDGQAENAIGEARADNGTPLPPQLSNHMKTPTHLALPVALDRLVRPLYSMQRCRKDDSRYGKIHFAHHEFETLCGLTADSNWWILTNRHDGDATCAKCIKTNS